VLEAEPERRRRLVTDTWQDKRQRMRDLCLSCHTASTIDGATARYDVLVELQDRSFTEPGAALVAELRSRGLVSPQPLDDAIEWSWLELWQRAGRRARLGAAMGSAADADLREVARLFYQRLLPDAHAAANARAASGMDREAVAVEALVAEIASRPEHAWALPVAP